MTLSKSNLRVDIPDNITRVPDSPPATHHRMAAFYSLETQNLLAASRHAGQHLALHCSIEMSIIPIVQPTVLANSHFDV